MSRVNDTTTDRDLGHDSEIIPDANPDIDYGWYAEFELRGYMSREFGGSDHDIWVEPNDQRAEYYDPFDPPSDHLLGNCQNHSHRRHSPDSDPHLCAGDATTYEQFLRDWPYLDVYDDRIVVPFNVTESLDDDPVDDHKYSQEFREKVLWPILSHMPVLEDRRREHPGHGVDYDGKYPYFQTAPDFYLTREDRDIEQYETYRIKKPDPRPIYVRVPPDHPMCELHQMFERRRRDNRTLLASVVARDAATGTGKTTLAVQLAKDWDQHGWTADRATLDPDEYAEKYTDTATPNQSCLLLDEAEQAADSRRSMSDENVKLTHLWATMRYREIYSIITLPSASMLDKRLRELADLYIVVLQRGVAVVYKTKIDDTEGEQFLQRLHRIRWQPLDDDPEYQRLTEMKADRMENYAETFAYGDDEDVDPDRIRHEAQMAKRNELIEQMAACGYTQAEIAEVVELNRSTISRILNGD